MAAFRVALFLVWFSLGPTSSQSSHANEHFDHHPAMPLVKNVSSSHLCAAQRRQSHKYTVEGNFSSSRVGFYLQAAHEDYMYLAEMLAGVRQFYPDSPIVFYSDAGKQEHETLCLVYNCTFIMAAESINADYKRTPRFSCLAIMQRILEAIALNNVPWIYYWEPDTRALGPLTRAPPQGMMQQLNYVFPFSKALSNEADLDAALHTMHPGQLCGHIHGYSTTGGTLFHGQEVAHRIQASGGLEGFYGSLAWQTLSHAWHQVPDRTSDVCLMSSALVAGMTIGQWHEYNELRHMNDKGVNGAPILPLGSKETCISCIAGCQQKHNSSVAWTSPQIAPPALDICIFEACGATRICPPLLHKLICTKRPKGRSQLFSSF